LFPGLIVLLLFSLIENRAEGPEPKPGGLSFHDNGGARLSFSSPVKAPPGSDGGNGATDETTEKKRPGRAVLEFFALMAYSQTKYWITYGDWIEDWHYRLTWEDQKKRLFGFEAWKFDSNNFNLNWSHALAGALYYEIARTNNLDVLESFLFTTAGSMYWEYVVEWRNVVSINDNIFNAFGGIPLGEAWFQLGRYFRDRTGTLNRILSFINPLMKFNDWVNGRPPTRGAESARGDFSFVAGGRNAPSTTGGRRRNQTCLDWRTRVDVFPEIGRPGEAFQIVDRVYRTDMSFNLSLGKRGLEEANLFARAVLLGGLKKRIDRRRRGYQVFLGLGTAFSYFRERSVAFYDSGRVKVRRGYDLRLEEPRDFRDRLAIVHIAGPFFELRAFSKRIRFRLEMDAYLDFALVNAFALNEYSRDNGLLGIKTPLLYYGYYHALGTSWLAAMTLEYRRIRFNGCFIHHRFNSVEGGDRFQDELTDDFDIRDFRTRYELSLFIPLGRSPLDIRIAHEGVDRWGRIKRVESRRLDSRYYLGMSVRF